MGEFFKGWRRKIGVLTLVTACAMSGMWIRSLTIRDVLAWKCFNVDFAIRSFEAGLGWQRYSPSDPNTSVGWLTDSGKKFFYFDPWWTYENFDVVATTSRMDWAGFNFGSIEWTTLTDPPKKGAFAVWIIPYWSLILPLTLLSAYLLVAKPRVAKPKKFAEPDRA